MDIIDLRGLATVLCVVAFFAVVYWAYGPSRKGYFDEAAQLPFADGVFDVVMANHILYHVPDMESAIAEMKRVLKPGGHLLCFAHPKPPH